jgi:hypothetical protein
VPRIDDITDHTDYTADMHDELVRHSNGDEGRADQHVARRITELLAKVKIVPDRGGPRSRR